MECQTPSKESMEKNSLESGANRKPRLTSDRKITDFHTWVILMGVLPMFYETEFLHFVI